jgi:hypothetical protein
MDDTNKTDLHRFIIGVLERVVEERVVRIYLVFCIQR